MKPATPPKLAAWLLYHQVGGYRAESLIGDLTEEYANGRGDAWYWAQALLAVARSYRRALRSYGLRILVAVAAGWSALLLGLALLERVWAIAQHGLSAHLPVQQLQVPDVFYSVAWTLLAGCVDFAVGRLVVRLYRVHPRLIAGTFSFSILVYMLPSIWGQVIGAMADSGRISSLAAELGATLFWMASSWLGGLWQIRSDTKSTKR